MLGFSKKLAVILTVAAALLANAGVASAQMRAGQVDIFMGLDFNYRDLLYNGRIFDVLVNLTPGVKWNMGHRWEIAAQAKIPVINQFGDQYKYITLSRATLSKQFGFGNRFRLKCSGGIFSLSRYGLDVKAMYAVNKWLAISGSAGVTGVLSMAGSWYATPMDMVTFSAGPEFWLDRWATQFKLRGGRFLYGDYGVIGEAMRHFRHVTVGVYGAYSSKHGQDAGFKVVVMLPPYKKCNRKVNFRPASYFRLTYSNTAIADAMGEYSTDPEQNERQGWFDHDLLPWGPDRLDNYPASTDKKKEVHQKAESEDSKAESKDCKEVITTEELGVIRHFE